MDQKQLQIVQSDEEIEIDLLRLLKAIRKRIWIVILASFLCGTIALGCSMFFITPQYQSSTLFYVNNNSLKVGSASVSISSDELTAAQSLVDTYIVILKARKTLMDVIDYGELDLSYEELSSMISAEAVNSTEVFEIVVTGPHPEQNLDICNAIAHVMPDKIADIVDGSSVRIVDYAVVASQQSSPDYAKNTCIGALLGMLASIGAIALMELLDHKIHSEEYLKENYTVPVLTTVPDMNKSGSGRYYKYHDPEKKKRRSRRALAREAKREQRKRSLSTSKEQIICQHMNYTGEEAYKHLRTKLMFSFSDDIGCHVIGITSSMPGEGKSVTSINLAYTMAQLGKKVLLIDGDMRIPIIGKALRLNIETGLSNYLVNDGSAEQLIQEFASEGGSTERSSSFHVITAGEIPPNPVELLSSLKLEILLDELRMDYDYILFDFPPVLEVADALSASRVLDGMLMIVREDFCDQRSLKKAMEQIDYVDSKVLGFVYNMSCETGADYQLYYKSGKRKPERVGVASDAAGIDERNGRENGERNKNDFI
ncbi:MAG: polysaccharide biosynthesis tyrosine autokinase [Bacillota bacterium]|nr:polysaccharide biosynthesis tyrosine autokinase [Bacillota bacterium]